MINELRLETHHRGRYLLLRCFFRSLRTNAIHAVVEDENEDALILELYVQEDESVRPARETMHEKIIVVEEPYFRHMSESEYCVRVDHIGDILWLPVGHDLVSNQ